MAFEKARVQPDGTTDERRVVIIDYNHLAYKYQYGSRPLSTRVDLGNGLTNIVDTTIPAYTIKHIVNTSRRGLDFVIVCMDSRLYSRKEAFKMESDKYEFGIDYKDNRKDSRSNTNALFSGIQLTENLLRQAGVTVLRQENYEADDLIFAAIQKAKKEYPDMPIDVITGDWDLAPLVDEQVHVYMVSRKMTYATEQGIKRNKYVELTPETTEEMTNQTSEFKKSYVPYNSLLLWKILRGDTSDNISPVKELNSNGKLVNRWTPLKMMNLIQQMKIQGVLEPDVWAYSPHKMYVRQISTGKTFTQEDALKMMRDSQLEKQDLFLEIGETENHEAMVKCIDRMIELSFFDDFDKEFILDRYTCMNLNGAFLETPTRRAPFIMTEPLTRVDTHKLQEVVEYLQITIPHA